MLLRAGERVGETTATTNPHNIASLPSTLAPVPPPIFLDRIDDPSLWLSFAGGNVFYVLRECGGNVFYKLRQ